MTAARRVDVEVVKTEPVSENKWNLTLAIAHGVEDFPDSYAEYVARHQPYHWRARAGNNEQIAQGESYFHATDAVDTVRLLADPATTVTLTVNGETEVLREGVAASDAAIALALLRRTAEMVVKSFREVEHNRQLYDAATHGCVALLAEALGKFEGGAR